MSSQSTPLSSMALKTRHSLRTVSVLGHLVARLNALVLPLRTFRIAWEKCRCTYSASPSLRASLIRTPIEGSIFRKRRVHFPPIPAARRLVSAFDPKLTLGVSRFRPFSSLNSFNDRADRYRDHMVTWPPFVEGPKQQPKEGQRKAPSPPIGQVQGCCSEHTQCGSRDSEKANPARDPFRTKVVSPALVKRR
jgi:hypothetical protein